MPATSAVFAGSVGVRVGGGDADGVGGADDVPVRVDGVDGDVEASRPRSARTACRSCRVAVPGAAVSPGSRIWSFANAPALIVVDGLVLAVIEPFVMSVDVNVAVPAVFARDRERLRAGDERGVGRQRRRWRR